MRSWGAKIFPQKKKKKFLQTLNFWTMVYIFLNLPLNNHPGLGDIDQKSIQ